MICSDGRTAMVDDAKILGIVHRNRGDLNRAVKALIDAANKGGGEDNITVVLFAIGTDVAGATEETAMLPPAEERETDEATLTEADHVPTIEDTRMLSREELEAMTGAGRDHHHR